MASTFTSQPSLSLLPHHTCKEHTRRIARKAVISRRRRSKNRFSVLATQEQPGNRQTDTRIHWDSPDEGWIGGSSANTSSQRSQLDADEKAKTLLENNFAELINEYADSHYQFLGVRAEADLEEIKAAYRRLSKEYHPDTTSLPIKTASDKFMRLRDIYAVLSDGEKRRFYDWTLAQEAASRQAERLRMRLEDPYMQDVAKEKPLPDMVDRLGGRNMDLSDQAMSALTIDVVAIVFSIGIFIYVAFFKDQG